MAKQKCKCFPDRLATIPGRNGKPSIIVDTNMRIFIGNEVSDSLELSGTELFGFNTGNYEVKLVDSDKRHTSGIAFRFTKDTDFIAENKVLMPICEFLHKCASARGLADVSIPDHVVSPKVHAPASWAQSWLDDCSLDLCFFDSFLLCLFVLFCFVCSPPASEGC